MYCHGKHPQYESHSFRAVKRSLIEPHLCTCLCVTHQLSPCCQIQRSFLCHLPWPQSSMWCRKCLIFLQVPPPLASCDTVFSRFLPDPSLPTSSSAALWLTSRNGLLWGLVLNSILFLGFIFSLGDLIGLSRSLGSKCHPNADDLGHLFPPLTFLPSFWLKFSC